MVQVVKSPFSRISALLKDGEDGVRSAPQN
jgi:hypothetical protein